MGVQGALGDRGPQGPAAGGSQRSRCRPAGRACSCLWKGRWLWQAKDLGRTGGLRGASCLVPAHATDGQTEPGQGMSLSQVATETLSQALSFPWEDPLWSWTYSVPVALRVSPRSHPGRLGLWFPPSLRRVNLLPKSLSLARGPGWVPPLPRGLAAHHGRSPSAGPAPSEEAGTKARFQLADALEQGTWTAFVADQQDSTLSLQLSTAANAPVGLYRLSLEASTGYQGSSFVLGHFTLLYNAWCPGEPLPPQGWPTQEGRWGWQEQGRRSIRWRGSPTVRALSCSPRT